MLPLVAGDRTIGVLEVAAPSRSIDEAWETLETIGDHVGFALQAMSEREDLRREVDMLERTASLGRDLVKAGSSEAAVQAGVGFVAERLKVPVAGWCEGPSGTLELAAVQGLAPKKLDEFRQAMPSIPRWGSLTVDEKETTERRFAGLVDVRGVSSLDVGGAVLLAGTPTQGVEASLEVVGALLAEVLRLRSTAALAERRNEHLDMGIAWTAHELRGPLLGVRAVLELMLQREETGPPDHEILRRSLRELDHLSGTAEALLAWAVGARPLRLRRADLVRVVDEAVESCRLQSGDERVVVHSPEHAFARIDPPTLRAAFANLLRNALAYAKPGTKVEVEIEEDGGRVLVSVKDRGPMIIAAEREAIFDPFVRGSAADGGRQSAGLGLFIARRIVEAHRGSIWVESDRQDTTFVVVLPIEQGRERRVAS